MRLAFFGSPELGVLTLNALREAGHDIAIAVTQPPARNSRRGSPTPTPVALAAAELGIPVSFDPMDATRVGAEIGVLMAYGALVKRSVLEKLRIINVHPSLLPRWRGATPVESAILAGDVTTGVSLMELVVQMDAGPLFAQTEVAIDANESARTLATRLVQLGNVLLGELLAHGIDGLREPRPQQGDVTYAPKLLPQDFCVDWSQSSEDILRRSRVGTLWTVCHGRRLQILELEKAARPDDGTPGEFCQGVVSTGDGAVNLLRVKPEGKLEMPGADWCRGARMVDGEILGETPEEKINGC